MKSSSGLTSAPVWIQLEKVRQSTDRRPLLPMPSCCRVGVKDVAEFYCFSSRIVDITICELPGQGVGCVALDQSPLWWCSSTAQIFPSALCMSLLWNFYMVQISSQCFQYFIHKLFVNSFVFCQWCFTPGSVNHVTEYLISLLTQLCEWIRGNFMWLSK